MIHRIYKAKQNILKHTDFCLSTDTYISWNFTLNTYRLGWLSFISYSHPPKLYSDLRIAISHHPVIKLLLFPFIHCISADDVSSPHSEIKAPDLKSLRSSAPDSWRWLYSYPHPYSNAAYESKFGSAIVFCHFPKRYERNSVTRKKSVCCSR